MLIIIFINDENLESENFDFSKIKDILGELKNLFRKEDMK